MPLTILSDSEVRSLLLSLSRDDILELQESLAEALHEYSTGTQESTGCCSANQPQRIAIPAPNNRTTLFMPATTSTSRGMKIVSLNVAPTPSASSQTSFASTKGSHSPSIASSISSAPSRTSTTSSLSSPSSPSASFSSLSFKHSSSPSLTEPSTSIGCT